MNVLSPREAYRLWAPTYSAETVVTALEEETVQSFAIPVAGRRLLDAACGTGRRLRVSDAGFAIGIDLTREMLPTLPVNELYTVGDVRALPFQAAEFDVVWCRLALGHLPDLADSYSELARVCRFGGSVMVTDFHPDAVAVGHRRTFRDTDGILHEIVHHVHSLEEHVCAADAAGLHTVEHSNRTIGPSVRDFYVRANRTSVYTEQVGLALVLGIVFAKCK
jgi:malonyl-CoA O-methyltransferase